jgi:hypothetical protein
LKREYEALVEQAKAILDLNWTGEYTQPGPRLYPHQWSWDSALIALAYAHYDPGRAEKELRYLFEAQWTNGLLPQIVFNPRFRDCFPGPSFWHAKESPHAPKRFETSGVVMPTLHATAVLAIYKAARQEAKEFLGYAFRKLKAWREYLYRDRDPRGRGSYTSAIRRSRGWTTPRCGIRYCSGCTSGRSRSRVTSAPISTP